MSILLTALLTIATAVVTTLVVEWLAKPGLEARKARILENDKNLRRMCAIVKEEYEGAALYYEEGRVLDTPHLWPEYRALSHSVHAPWGRQSNATFDAMNRQMLDADGPNVNPLDIMEQAHTCASFLLVPRWRLLARRKAYRKVVTATTPKQVDPSGDALDGLSS